LYPTWERDGIYSSLDFDAFNNKKDQHSPFQILYCHRGFLRSNHICPHLESGGGLVT